MSLSWRHPCPTPLNSSILARISLSTDTPGLEHPQVFLRDHRRMILRDSSLRVLQVRVNNQSFLIYS